MGMILRAPLNPSIRYSAVMVQGISGGSLSHTWLPRDAKLSDVCTSVAFPDQLRIVMVAHRLCASLINLFTQGSAFVFLAKLIRLWSCFFSSVIKEVPFSPTRHQVYSKLYMRSNCRVRQGTMLALTSRLQNIDDNIYRWYRDRED